MGYVRKGEKRFDEIDPPRVMKIYDEFKRIHGPAFLVEASVLLRTLVGTTVVENLKVGEARLLIELLKTKPDYVAPQVMDDDALNKKVSRL